MAWGTGSRWAAALGWATGLSCWVMGGLCLSELEAEGGLFSSVTDRAAGQHSIGERA